MSSAKNTEPEARGATHFDGVEHGASNLYGEEAARVVALRAEKPKEALEVRLSLLDKAHPGIVERDFGYVSHVLDPGWSITAVPEDGVIYTLGLHYNFGQFELLIGEQPLADDADRTPQLTHVLNALGRRVQDGLRIAAGDALDVESFRLTFHTFEDAHFDRFPCGYLASFEEMFEDRFHSRGGTLPILWASLETIQ